ncbi:MAG: PQQ-dependent sugar dehydrogenase [Flavobacteriales bacterium]|nr:PQQ-dependent sugar dehydrogenase [Flavobacteriales bacterium]
MKRTLSVTLLGASLALQAQNPVQLKLNTWATGLTKVLDITHCGDSRLFVVRQPGIIQIITDSNTVLPTPFLNIQGLVYDVGGEQGLLGMAFDPDYHNNGYFYVHYTGGTGNGISTIARYSVNPNDSNLAIGSSGEILYTWPQPYANHNGGDLDFGPDGYLYIALGDGGSAGDPQNNAQDLSDPLGDILRIKPEPDSTYSIPPDNPWANAGGDTLREIWASGLRNPFRFGFDRLTGDVWIGDVGQNAWEELDFLPAASVPGGPNFGWRCYEGDQPYNVGGSCLPYSQYVAPVVVRNNVLNGGTWCSIMGGRVYRGTEFPRLYGRHIYTDYCSGQFYSIRPDGFGDWIDENLLSSGLQGFACIGDGADGSLYACNVSNGNVYRIVDKCPMPPPTITSDGWEIESSPASTYQWYLNGVAIPNATGPVLVPTVAGDYHVAAGFGGGCTLRSDTLTFIATGLDELSDRGVRCFPTPAREELIVERGTALGHVSSVLLVDGMGRTVRSLPWNGAAPQMHLEVGELPAGGYGLLLLGTDGGVLARTTAIIAR